MSLDGFLTFLGLALAIYALLPPIGRLRIKLQLVLQVTLAAIAIVAVFYLQFFEFLAPACPVQMRSFCGWMIFNTESHFTPEKASFLVLFAWMIIAVAAFMWLPASSRALGAIATLFERLLYEERFGEAVDFIKPHLKLVERAANIVLPSQRLDAWINGTTQSDIEDWPSSPNDEKFAKKIKVRKTRRLFRPFLLLLPSSSRAQEGASRIVHSIYFSKELLAYIARQRPAFACDLIRVDVRERFHFSSEFLRFLISHPDSRLYEEVRRNLEYGSMGSYSLDPKNPILRSYFEDATIAATTNAWKPIGDYALESVNAGDKDRISFLNGTPDNFESEQWREPVYIAIHFFNIMVRSAASQGVNYDMWLAYLRHFVEALERKYDDQAPGAQTEQLIPSRAGELIRESISVMCGWLLLYQRLETSSIHRRISASPQDRAITIPTSAAKRLGEMMRVIAMSDRIGELFAASLLESILESIRKLMHGDDEKRLRAYAIQALIRPDGRNCDERYGRRLAKLFPSVDSYLLHSLDDFKLAFSEAFPAATVL